MKGLFYLVLIGVAGYFGYSHFTGQKIDVGQRVSALLNRAGATTSAPEESSATLFPQPVFESKIEAPATAPAGEKQFAPPGVFYVVERVSMETASGVKALSPGEPVKLMQRMNDGRMRVTTGDADFVVKQSQVTNDLDLAREAEKREFVARGGQL